MQSESMFDWYCDHLAPPGSCGKTEEDVQALMGKYADKERRERLYCVMKELHEHKCSLVDDINRKRNNNR